MKDKSEQINHLESINLKITEKMKRLTNLNNEMTDLIEQERIDTIEETKRVEKEWYSKMQKTELKMVLVKNKVMTLAN